MQRRADPAVPRRSRCRRRGRSCRAGRRRSSASSAARRLARPRRAQPAARLLLARRLRLLADHRPGRPVLRPGALRRPLGLERGGAAAGGERDGRPCRSSLCSSSRSGSGATSSSTGPTPRPSPHDPLLQHKAAYLNEGFFLVRAVIYFAVWTAVAWLTGASRRGRTAAASAAITRRLQTLGAPAVILFGVTLTFASFDWMMSLEPHWFSTMFGVYFFAGCVVAIFAFLILLVLAAPAPAARCATWSPASTSTTWASCCSASPSSGPTSASPSSS